METVSNPGRVGVSPEDIFLAWFLRLPHNADVAAAARAEIARLDRLDLMSETTHRLRIMLEQASLYPLHVHHGRGRLQH